MSDALSYSLQRLTAVLLAVMVLIHLALIIYAIDGGLTSNEILSRTRSSFWWPLFYGLFVISVAIHAPIGVRNILREWPGIPLKWLDPAMMLLAAVLLFTGLRAVVAIM